MKYIKSTHRYDLTFTVGRKKIRIESKQVDYRTGTVLTTGVNEIDKDVYTALSAQPVFQGLIKSGDFEIVSKKDLELADPVKSALNAKDAEIAELKKQLEEASGEKKESKPQTEKGTDAADPAADF